jgi:integrase/recombinase XerD
LDARGRVGASIHVAHDIAKNGRARQLPVHPLLRGTLTKLHLECGKPARGPVIRSQKGGHMTARSVVNWFAREYSQLGMEGCSSHSGRRTFITRTARLVARAGGSLRDVQILVGHRDLATTQRYIDGDSRAQRKLVAMP